VLLLAAAEWSSGCLFYDSRWGESTAEQKHAAAHLQPAALDAPRGAPVAERRSASIRACATRAYAAETLAWQERFDELIRNANGVLEPSLGLTLRNAGTTSWTPEHGEGGLSEVIADLPSCEGPETDWVVALVQSTPKVVADFHVLGRGQAYSPYLAIRAPNDPAELEALTRALPDLDEATRQKEGGPTDVRRGNQVASDEPARGVGGRATAVRGSSRSARGAGASMPAREGT
jgi:hypothetical protein